VQQPVPAREGDPGTALGGPSLPQTLFALDPANFDSL